MSNLYYFLIFFFLAIVLGLVAGFFLGEGVTGCTEMACSCQQEGEIFCNSCSSEDPLFALGIINIFEVCSAREILICKNNEYVSRRYDVTGECSIKVKWFDFVLDYVE